MKPLSRFLLPTLVIPLSVRGCAFFLLAFCAGPGISPGQTTFERTYGKLTGSSVQQTSDGGYIIAGFRSSNVFDGSGLVCLVKTDSSGDTLWTRTYADGSNNPFVQQTSDGGYIITGHLMTHIQVGASFAYLVKTDSEGDRLWARSYYFGKWPSFTHAYSVQQTPDGGYIIAGDSRGCIRLLKTNASGDTLWTQSYGGSYDEAHSVQQTSDGGYIVAGYTNYPSFYRNFYLLKTNDSGDTLWARTYGHGSGNSAQQTSDGGYIAAGSSFLSGDPYTERVSLLKTNDSGDTLWTRTYGQGIGYSVQQTSDGGYVIAAGSYLMKTDSSGDTIWTRTYNGSVRSACPTSDGGYVIAGTSSSSYGDDPGIYLAKTRPDGLLEAPDPPMLSQPYDGAKGISTSPTLGWLWCPRAQSYTLQVALDSFFTELIVNDSTINSTSKLISDLPNYAQHYWRVNARNQAGTSEYSAVWTFTTIVAAPMLVVPLNGATNQSTTLTLVWNRSAGASQYRLQVGVDSTLAGGVFLDDSTLEDTSRIVSGLETGTRYFWRVRAMYEGASSTWSQMWKFGTKLALPAPVTLASPVDKATVGKDSVRFLWKPGWPSVQHYRWELGTDSLFGSPAIDSLLTDTSKVVRALTGGQTYWWRVSAENASGWGSFSVSNRFTTLLTDVSEHQDLPHEFGLSQNYPNPFNPSTTIRYGLPNRSRVTLTVFNTLGQLVALLQNGEQEAGYHEVRFDASLLSSGVYFYRLKAGGFVETKRLSLVR